MILNCFRKPELSTDSMSRSNVFKIKIKRFKNDGIDLYFTMFFSKTELQRT